MFALLCSPNEVWEHIVFTLFLIKSPEGRLIAFLRFFVIIIKSPEGRLIAILRFFVIIIIITRPKPVGHGYVFSMAVGTIGEWFGSFLK